MARATKAAAVVGLAMVLLLTGDAARRPMIKIETKITKERGS